ncbi:MAG: hypothetical protein IT443_04980 [Phycisphaeraceae bacterium]|nr:hypothetical protein [Phycisphaeraceae bacterium]
MICLPWATARAEVFSAPGVWLDQDKTHLATEISQGASWGHNYFLDANDNGEHDIGEAWSDEPIADWTYQIDNSCWMAAAANVVRYVGGGDWYMKWAYDQAFSYPALSDPIPQPTMRPPGWGYSFEDPGNELNAFASLGYDTLSIRQNLTFDGWEADPVAWISAQLSAGLPVVMGIRLPNSHDLTIFSIDTATQTITYADSDFDYADVGVAGNFFSTGYSWDGISFKVNYKLTSKPGLYNGVFRLSSIDPTGQTNRWQGTGVGNWINPNAWSVKHAPLPNDQVKIDSGQMILSRADGRAGTLAVAGTAESPAELWVLEGGLAVGGAVQVAGQANSAGTVMVEGAGAILNAGGEIHVGQLGAGALRVRAGGEARATDRLKIWTTGTVDLDGGSVTVSGAGGVLEIAGGVVVGSGQISAAGGVVNGGRVAPGQNVGVLEIVSGDYAQTTEGMLDIEIGGLTAGADYDQLLIGGNANLAGMLNVSLSDGFVPQEGDRFTILLALALSGTFDSWTLNYDIPKRHLTAELTYATGAGAVVLEILQVQHQMRGDFNGDDLVTLSDIDPFKLALADAAAYAAAYPDVYLPGTEPNGDGVLTLSDILAFKSLMAQGSMAQGSSIPEPATAVSLLAAGLAMLSTRPRPRPRK